MDGKRMAAGVDFQPMKCAKRHDGDEDRISQLPDDILIDIVSRLSLKKAAHTSVLSSRWVNLWKYVPRLIFDDTGALFKISKQKELLNVERNKYINWVNRVLRSHKSDYLKELLIRFDLSKSSHRAVTYWLNSAFARPVEKLELDLVTYRDDLCAFPDKILKQRNDVTSLSQTSSREPFVYHPHKFIIFNHLKQLSLKSLNVSGSIIEFLLHKCPVLEHLVVHHSVALIDLEICGPSLALKHLEIRYCSKLRSIKVSNSNIVSLNVHRPEVLCLENVPRLVDVCASYLRFSNYFEKVFDWFSCCTSQLEILSLQTFELEKNFERYKFPELPNLKKLVICLQIENDESLLGLTSLMKVSPKLQEFVLELDRYSDPPRKKKKTMMAASFPHQHLRVVQFIGYYSCSCDLKLLSYILQNSESLVKVIIDPRNPVHTRDRNPWFGLYNTYYLKLEQNRRNCAKKQLKSIVPPHIQLVIL